MNAQAYEEVVVSAIGDLVRRRDPDVVVEPSADLYDDLGMDSLEVAELSVYLEDTFGRDPYSEGALARSAVEIVDFYRI